MLLITENIPIRQDEHGRWRVGNTRVLLDLVIQAFLNGETPETITEQYPTLSLDDVYLTIGYYLRHRHTLDVYFEQENEQAHKAQLEDEAHYPPTLTRDILLERLTPFSN